MKALEQGARNQRESPQGYGVFCWIATVLESVTDSASPAQEDVVIEARNNQIAELLRHNDGLLKIVEDLRAKSAREDERTRIREAVEAMTQRQGAISLREVLAAIAAEAEKESAT